MTFSIRPPPGLLPVLGRLERYMTPTLDSALLISSRAGADLGQTLDRLKSFVNWVSSFPSRAQCIMLLCTHLYHTSFQYISITCNVSIACYIVRVIIEINFL